MKTRFFLLLCLLICSQAFAQEAVLDLSGDSWDQAPPHEPLNNDEPEIYNEPYQEEPEPEITIPAIPGYPNHEPEVDQADEPDNEPDDEVPPTSTPTAPTPVVSTPPQDEPVEPTEPEVATAPEVKASPVWSTLVLYREDLKKWKKIAKRTDLKELYFQKGKSLVDPKLSSRGKVKKTKKGTKKAVRGFGEDSADTMVDWLLSQGSLYNDLVNKVSKAKAKKKSKKVKGRSADAIVVMTRINPETGQPEFKAGVWKNFAVKGAEGSPGFLDASKKKVGKQIRKKVIPSLKSEWQADDNKTINIDGEDHQVDIIATQLRSSPILLDIFGIGYPDLLSGMDWRKSRGGDTDLLALRSFDLDGKGLNKWEWIGPRTALLLHSDVGTNFQPSGRNLFGNTTWGKSWVDGYEAMASLDKNRDGKLTENELENIYLWVDQNADAIAQPGEISSPDKYDIASINVKAVYDEVGNSQQPEGFTRKDGTSGATWDWWSNRGPEGTPDLNLYVWQPIDEKADLPGGTFLFNKHQNGDIEMLSFVSQPLESENDANIALGIPFEVEREGALFKWSRSVDNAELVSHAVIEDGNLVGVTRIIKDGNEEKRYGWVAVAVSGNSLQ